MVNAIVNLAVMTVLTVLIAVELGSIPLINPRRTTFIIAPSSENVGNLLCAVFFCFCECQIRIVAPCKLYSNESCFLHVTHNIIRPSEIMGAYCWCFALPLNYFVDPHEQSALLLEVELQELVLLLFCELQILVFDLLY